MRQLGLRCGAVEARDAAGGDVLQRDILGAANGGAGEFGGRLEVGGSEGAVIFHVGDFGAVVDDEVDGGEEGVELGSGHAEVGE